MTKAIPKESVKRFQKLILDAKNLVHCYKQTGVNHQAIKKIIETGFAKEDQFNKLVEYCNEVELVNS